MTGEINSTQVIISNTGGDIVGQMEATITFNGTPIDISNKSYEDWVTLMDAITGCRFMRIQQRRNIQASKG
jgi:hypothetical protein